MNQTFNNVYSQFEIVCSENKNLNSLLDSTVELLKDQISHYDWVGFYILDEKSDTLILGPFRGEPTEHTHIRVGKGVCGQVAENKKTMIVQDITKEDNYISCSVDVRSEIVVPILVDGRFVAEIDIDSHTPSPFTSEDEILLGKIADRLAEKF